MHSHFDETDVLNDNLSYIFIKSTKWPHHPKPNVRPGCATNWTVIFWLCYRPMPAHPRPIWHANSARHAPRCWTRNGIDRFILARLEREGVIAGYTLRLGQDVLDQGLQAFVGITVQPKSGRDVVRQLERMPEVRQLCAVSGEFDYVVLLRAETALRMNTLLDEMGNFDGVVKTTTSVALEWKIDRT